MSIFQVVRLFLSFMALKKLKERSLVMYLKVLQGVRKSIRALFLVLVFAQFFMVGLLMAVYSAIQLLPSDLNLKLYVALGVGIGFMALSTIAVLIMTSDSLWFKISGVQDHFKD